MLLDTNASIEKKKRLWTCAAKSPTIHNDDAPHVNLDLKKTPNLAIGYEQFHETLNLGHEKIIQNTARTSSRVIGGRCLLCVRLQGALRYKLLLEDLAHAGDPPILSSLHLWKRSVVLSTDLEKISQNVILPQRRVKTENTWNHHRVLVCRLEAPPSQGRQHLIKEWRCKASIDERELQLGRLSWLVTTL